jgi:hypothetical protein
MVNGTKQTLLDWLLASVNKQSDACDESFPGNRDTDGYARVAGLPATRLLWTHVHGPIPKGMQIRHTCNNTRCTNINHLILGTPKDNMMDKVKAGNHRKHARITDDMIVRIIELSQTNGSSAIARMLGLKQANVSHIIVGIIASTVTIPLFQERHDLTPHPSWIVRHGHHINRESKT